MGFGENVESFTSRAASNENHHSSIKITKMDEATKDFYSAYGNCSREELDNCLSCEVKTIDLLKQVENQIDKKNNTANTIPKDTIAKMIKNENSHIVENSTPKTIVENRSINIVINSAMKKFGSLITSATKSNGHS